MNIRNESRQISIAKAIVLLVETALPRGTKEKVLVVGVNVLAENIDTEEMVSNTVNFVFYRPSNYTFVGTFEGNVLDFREGIDIEFKSHHDSCWSSDGVEGTISKMSDKLSSEVEKLQKKNAEGEWFVYRSFPYDARFYEGMIETNPNNKDVKFISKNKE